MVKVLFEIWVRSFYEDFGIMLMRVSVNIIFQELASELSPGGFVSKAATLLHSSCVKWMLIRLSLMGQWD
jgi:hypothetical protein